MSSRRIILANSQFYHIFNRTIADEIVFTSKKDTSRSLALLEYYRNETKISYSRFSQFSETEKLSVKQGNALVEIHAFALMPNHYHFLLRQKVDNGISKFISQFQIGLAKYINLKRDRNGSLFCHNFKAKFLESEEQLLHVSRYIHLNPVTSFLIKEEDLATWPLTSFNEYVNGKQNSFLTTDLILSIKKRSQYKKFVLDQAEYQKKLHSIASLLIDYQGSKLFNPEG